MRWIKHPHRIILFLTLVNILFFIWQHRALYLRPYDYEYFGKLYENSQWVKGSLSNGGIGDDGYYAFAGYYYITGGDISQVSFEHQPLAKYLIGSSIILFGNELVINIFYSLILLLIVYLLGNILLQDKTQAALTTFITSIDRLVTNQFAISMLDLPMTIFFLAGIYWYISAIKTRKKKFVFFLASLFFSLSFVTRFFPILIIIIALLAFGLIKKGRDYWLPFIIYTVILIPTIYLLAHLAYFFYHPSLIEFLRYQWWIIHWRLGEAFVPGNILATMITGHYKSWWQNGVWVFSDDWNYLTPLIFILGLVGLYRWRKLFPHRIISLMVVVFIFYVSVGTVGVAKYILPVYPILTIASVETSLLYLDSIFKKTCRCNKN